MKTNRKNRSLLLSATAILISVAMLVGTTLAWFTDSETNYGNIITTGTLDITVTSQDLTATAAEGTPDYTITGTVEGVAVTYNLSTDGTAQNLADANATPIIYNSNWESGCVDAKLITIENTGSLAAQISIKAIVEDGGLQDALWIDLYTVTTGSTGIFNPISMSELETALASRDSNIVKSGESFSIIVIYGMNESAGNTYQDTSFSADLQFIATQATFEEDGLGRTDYDADAVGDVITVSTADELKAQIAAVNDGTLTNGTLILTSDISYGADIALTELVNIDLNGYTLTCTSFSMIDEDSTETVDIENGIIIATSSADESITVQVPKGSINVRNVLNASNGDIVYDASDSTLMLLGTTNFFGVDDTGEAPIVNTSVTKKPVIEEDTRVVVETTTDVSLNISSNVIVESFGEVVADSSEGGDTSAGGDVSVTGSIAISSAADLLALAAAVNSGDTDAASANYYLTTDIDLTGETWTPIGNGSRSSSSDDYDIRFTGTFDGKGYTISGIDYTNNVDNTGAAVFGIVDGATIKNLTVANSSFTNTEDAAAGIVGIVLGDGTTTISNCTTAADVTITGDSIAGIVSRLYATGTTNVTDCTNSATVNASSKAGGIACIIAKAGTANFSGCVNNGTVSGGSSGLGGIVGFSGEVTAVTITDCSNTGEIGTSSDKWVGGMVGYASAGNDYAINFVTNCTNSGTITASTTAGGIMGIITQNGWTVENCTNTAAASVTSSGGTAGGVVGSANNSATIQYCTNEGCVTATTYAGGICGNLYSNSTVKYCSGGDESAVITATNAGRLIGYVTNGPYGASISYVYVDDSIEDDYSIPTLGALGMDTSWAYLFVMDGTFYGIPNRGTSAPGYLIFADGTTWVQDATTTIKMTEETYYYSPSNNNASWTTTSKPTALPDTEG